jgi:hypothetical protein
MPNIMLSLLVAGGALLCSTDAFPQARPLFTQHERQSHAAVRPNPLCRPEPYETPITYSELFCAILSERRAAHSQPLRTGGEGRC